jgi:hypothetical protein
MPAKAMNNISIIRLQILGIHFGYTFVENGTNVRAA